MSDYEVHMGDIGTIVKVNLKEAGLPLDLTDAEVMKIRFERKDRTSFQVDAVQWGDDPTAGIIYCLSTDAFFTQKGDMTIQTYVEFPGGKWHTSTETFKIEENIIIVEAP